MWFGEDCGPATAGAFFVFYQMTLVGYGISTRGVLSSRTLLPTGEFRNCFATLRP